MKKLRHIFILLFVALISFSCGPDEGDIYENLLTKERIKIEKTGDCQEIKEAYERINAALAEANPGKSKGYLYRNGITTPVVSEPETGNCFAYKITDRYRLGNDVYEATPIILEPLSKLKEDYKKIN